MEIKRPLRATGEIAGYPVRPGLFLSNGASSVPGGVCFTIHSAGATACQLCLFRRTEQEPFAVLPFPDQFCIGNTWSMIVFGLDIKEFEYAAKKAVAGGVGSFAVCAGDYGWHLIYVTNVFEAGSTYGTPDWSKIKEEGTFENLFFEWIKSNDISDVTTTHRTKILSDFNKDATVTKYQNRYQDLLDLGN